MDYEAAAVPAALGASLADSGLRHLNRTLLLHSHLYLLSYRSAKSLLIRSGGYDLNVAYDSNFLPLRVPSERQARAWASSLRMLDQLVESARALKVPLVLVVFPMEMQLDQPTLDLYRRTLHLTLDASALDGTPQRRLAEFAWARSIAFVDLLPAFRDARGQGLFLRRSGISHDWAHPSPLGHSLAADTILLTLQNLNLVPRRKTT